MNNSNQSIFSANNRMRRFDNREKWVTPAQAKFDREAKENPTDWIIHPENGRCKLVFVGEATSDNAHERAFNFSDLQ